MHSRKTPGIKKGTQRGTANNGCGASVEKQMEDHFDRLWPICRSIMGQGYRDSLRILSELMPMNVLRFKTGQKVLDWTVPKEWSVRDAYLIDPDGKKRADFKVNNLHLVNYSAPFSGRLSLSDLRPHLHSLPDLPHAIPYLTTYYREDWGFCVSHADLKEFPDGMYEVFIDTSLNDGVLEIGETVIPGESKKEILFSSYLCHPSMANNELSGPLVLAFLYQRILAMPRRRFTYRFVINPETIGAICYLKKRGEHFKKHLTAGYIVTCVGDPGTFTYKQSRQGNSAGDRAARLVLKETGEHRIVRFDPANGSDERQYCSPGFNLPVGSLMRTMYCEYPEYHTSLDNKTFVRFFSMAQSVDTYFRLVEALEANRVLKNTVFYGEPQLGRRGLYPSLGSQKTISAELSALLWCLNLFDGTRDLLAVSEDSGLPIQSVLEATAVLTKARLLAEIRPKKLSKTFLYKKK